MKTLKNSVAWVLFTFSLILVIPPFSFVVDAILLRYATEVAVAFSGAEFTVSDETLRYLTLTHSTVVDLLAGAYIVVKILILAWALSRFIGYQIVPHSPWKFHLLGTTILGAALMGQIWRNPGSDGTVFFEELQQHQHLTAFALEVLLLVLFGVALSILTRQPRWASWSGLLTTAAVTVVFPYTYGIFYLLAACCYLLVEKPMPKPDLLSTGDTATFGQWTAPQRWLRNTRLLAVIAVISFLGIVYFPYLAWLPNILQHLSSAALLTGAAYVLSRQLGHGIASDAWVRSIIAGVIFLLSSWIMVLIFPGSFGFGHLSEAILDNLLWILLALTLPLLLALVTRHPRVIAGAGILVTAIFIGVFMPIFFGVPLLAMSCFMLCFHPRREERLKALETPISALAKHNYRCAWLLAALPMAFWTIPLFV